MAEEEEEEEEEDWQWVHSPPHRLHDSPRYDDDEYYGELFGRDDAALVPPTWQEGHLHTNTAQLSENLSSTASSPILRHGRIATVMAKEHVSALDALQLSITEWIEPQLVFTRPHGQEVEGFEVYKIFAHLRKLPKAKEAFMSLLSDPAVCDAVTSNKAFRELASERTDGANEDGLEGRDSTFACRSSLGRKACKLLKERLMEAVDIVLSLMGAHTSGKSVVDELDPTAKSCILLVTVVIFLVIGKRSEEGFFLAHPS